MGAGEAESISFCAIMNLPAPLTRFKKYIEKIGKVLSYLSEMSMQHATEEAVETNNNSRNLLVSLDGSWMKRATIA